MKSSRSLWVSCSTESRLNEDPGPAVHARELVLQVYRFADPLRQTKACHQSMPTGLESEAVEGV